jgi:hypothetical protein
MDDKNLKVSSSIFWIIKFYTSIVKATATIVLTAKSGVGLVDRKIGYH